MAVDGPRGVDPAELAEMRAVHAHVGDDDLGERVLREPDHLQDAQRLVVERDRARRHPDVGQLVDDERSDAVAPEQPGDRRADGAVPDDQDVDFFRKSRHGESSVARGAIVNGSANRPSTWRAAATIGRGRAGARAVIPARRRR